MAYLDAFGVRDLGALVEAARRLVGDEMTDDRGICAALTPADETR